MVTLAHGDRVRVEAAAFSDKQSTAVALPTAPESKKQTAAVALPAETDGSERLSPAVALPTAVQLVFRLEQETAARWKSCGCK